MCEAKTRLTRAELVDGLHTSVAPGKSQLANGPFKVDVHRHNPVARPVRGYKTCGPSAHSKQTGLEILLGKLIPRRAAVGSASFDNIDILSKSWAAGLVHTVSETARHLDRPTVLINEACGSFHLAVLSLGRIILGWPLTSVSDSALACNQQLQPGGLEPILLTDPCPYTLDQGSPAFAQNCKII